jgi:hypothetical protein
LCQGQAQRVVTLTVAGTKTATVDAHHNRERTIRVLRASEVELHPSAARFSVSDISFEGDGVWDDGFNGPCRNKGQTVEEDGEHGRETRHHEGKGVDRVDRLEE